LGSAGGVSKCRANDVTEKSPQTILCVDVGGSHVKIRLNSGGPSRSIESGPDMTATAMAKSVRKLAGDWRFEAIAIGYPGPVLQNRITAEPHNLGSGWVDFDFEKAFGHPVRIVNDALMQAIGSYRSGRMLFLGLGTGLGSAMVVDNVCLPMELAHLPYRKHLSFEDYLGERGLKRRGKHKWRKSVEDVVSRLAAALQVHDVVIGGGNVDKLKSLPADCRRGANKNAFRGGFRVWLDDNLSL
jgi:polyphosphate glucokinase